MMSPIPQLYMKLAKAVTAATALSLAMGAGASAEKSWRFKVYLDDQEIGYHDFHLSENGTRETLVTAARFDVSFLKIPLFRYRHSNTEVWEQRCLKTIESSTRKNGEKYHVKGAAGDNYFKVNTRAGEQILPNCISTFAYWDKSFLEHEMLLNPQTGEYGPVNVDYLGERPTPGSNGAGTAASNYRLSTEDTDIELWYSADGQWIALQSSTESGRLVRYIME